MLCIKVSFIRIAKAKETKYKEKTGFFPNFSYLHSVSNFTGIRIRVKIISGNSQELEANNYFHNCLSLLHHKSSEICCLSDTSSMLLKSKYFF